MESEQSGRRDAVNDLLTAFSAMRAAINTISRGLMAVQRESSGYRVLFHNGQPAGRICADANECEIASAARMGEALVINRCLPEWVNSLYESQVSAEAAIRRLPPGLLRVLNRMTEKAWRASVVRDCLNQVLKWPGQAGDWRAWGVSTVCPRLEDCLSLAAESDPHAAWTHLQQLLIGYGEDLAAASVEMLSPGEGGTSPQTVALALPQVNLDANQVRYRGRCHDVSADGALLFHKLVESHPQAISASALSSKPSRVRASLPDALQAIIVAEPGKGYRLKLD